MIELLKHISSKADELAREYNRTKDPKIKEEWFKLIRKIQPPSDRDWETIY